MNIIPCPAHLKVRSQQPVFWFTKQSKWLGDPELLAAVTPDFCSFINKAFPALPEGTGESVLQLSLAPGGHSESYSLCVHPGKVVLTAPAENGLFYGLQTLKQILLQNQGGAPELDIQDSPRFPLRSFMLDSGRYFYPVEQVKHFIEVMAAHKINTFHWHLTEDQGWRVEIKKYPRLTEIGSHRSHTNFGCRPHGGFYTQQEIREVVAYAHAHYMQVMPEFDVPGHTVSAIACYPWLSCFDRSLPVATHWGVKHDILCAGKESTFEFVFHVLDELCELFPDPYFHIGGDEAVKTRWKLCPHCQKRIKEEGMNNEEELQQYFMSRVSRYLKEKGKTSLMWNWDSIDATPWLDPDIIMQFCGLHGDGSSTLRDLQNGRKFLNSSVFPYYLDLPFGWFNIEKTYDYDPALSDLKGITPQLQSQILGVEGPLWTEYVPNMKKADYCTYPRIGAIAETGWSPAELRDYARFEQHLDSYYQLLHVYGVHPASLKQAKPGFLRGKLYALWFNRRQLHWQGLHNLIDNALVAHKAKKRH